MRYASIHAHRGQFSIERPCRILRVSRRGYYAWRRRGISTRERQRQQRDVQIAEAFAAQKAHYGAPRLLDEQREQGCQMSRKTLDESLRRQGLRARAGTRFRVVTTDSNHALAVAPNRLDRDFTATAPNQKGAGDITYLRTLPGWLYLAVVLDLYSRQVVGYALADHMRAELVCDALKAALGRRGMPRGVLVHSDRGSPYCSKDYRDLLDDHGLIASMSRLGNCWDHAPTESCFHSMKVEACRDEPWMTHKQLRHPLFQYSEVDYNRTRRHSTIGYLSPEVFVARKAD